MIFSIRVNNKKGDISIFFVKNTLGESNLHRQYAQRTVWLTLTGF